MTLESDRKFLSLFRSYELDTVYEIYSPNPMKWSYASPANIHKSRHKIHLQRKPKQYKEKAHGKWVPRKKLANQGQPFTMQTGLYPFCGCVCRDSELSFSSWYR